MKILTLATALMAVVSLAIAQPAARYSSTTGDVSLSGSSTALTIQQPAANGKQVQFEAAVVYCSVACSVTQAQNGAAATATAATINPLLPYTQAAIATAWSASNASGGTAAGGILHIAAGSFVTIDISKLALGNGGGTAANYTVTVGSITGTANITIFWNER